MCSYEKAGQPGYKDLGFYKRDLGNWETENFPIIQHSSPVTGTKIRFRKWAAKMA